ncbi:MAG: DUF4296 domain-containing protein [Flavobacteriales bacterium]|nr:DUF4296 domain-containing protein [Flavobacteriales bacterium]HRH71049.1 DUF4296 domain-containing protein [Flavobacteriales bacterium]
MRKLSTFVLLALLSACSSDRDAVPEGLLDREHFKQALLEAQLIEARMNHELVVSHAAGIPGEEYYAEMFKAQGTTKEQFQKSFTYYSGHPVEMKAIYEEIFAELSRRKDEQPH